MSRSEDDENLLRSLLATFAVEAAEHLQAMNRHLISLENGADDPLVRAELFREAHSMKGAARAVNLLDLEGLAHELEDIFAGLRDDPARPGQAVLERAYHTLDAMAELVQTATGADQAAGADPDSAHPDRDRAHPDSAHPDSADPDSADPDRMDDAADAGRPAQVVLPGAWTAGPPRLPGDTVRVATAKLDALMAEVGELLVTRIAFEQRLADVYALDGLLADRLPASGRPRHGARSPRTGAPLSPPDSLAWFASARAAVAELRRGLQADVRRMTQVTEDLQDDVRRMRMVPVAAVFEVFPRMVRDLAQASGKEAVLILEGGATEADRSLLELLKDPLTHLLRNSVDHGIEPPRTRAGTGKPRSGTIRLSARQRSDMLVLEVADDGAGIDPATVRAAAVDKGLLGAAAGQDLPDRDAISLIFRSGLSTSPAVTDLSGRGVGLDVVRDSVDRLHGSIEVRSTPGRGTTFTLRLPLSISTMHCLMVEAAGQCYALPAAYVQQVVWVADGTIHQAGGRAVTRVGDRPVTLARLADVLGAGTAEPGADPGSRRPAVVLAVQDAHVALLVDRLRGTQELVVKSLPPPLAGVRHVAGAAVMGTGEVAMILNPADLVARVERGQPHATETPAAERDSGPATILLVEDSITTRTLEKNVLQAAGYQVAAAADGLAGWHQLSSGGRYDLVVTDVEMPQMDGFELTARIRADPRLQDLPVVLVTSRDSPEDHQRGVQVGADAYIVKGGLDHSRLLETIRRLI